MVAKKPLQTGSRLHHRAVGISLIVIGILIGIAILAGFGRSARHIYGHDDPTIIKQLVIQSVQNSKYDAPIDPKTGDSYFADARLYIPHQADGPRLTYSYDSETKVLQISSRQTLARAVAVATQQTTTNRFFNNVPQLQACSRGVTILAETPSDPAYGSLRGAVQLSDGSQRYLFSEDACAYLEPVIAAAKSIKLF